MKSNFKKVHFVGIGGIGVSAIARMMLAGGKMVSGSDTSASLITEELQKLGAEIFLKHEVDNIGEDIDLLRPHRRDALLEYLDIFQSLS